MWPLCGVRLLNFRLDRYISANIFLGAWCFRVHGVYVWYSCVQTLYVLLVHVVKAIMLDKSSFKVD